jgi:DNA repair protein RecO (recombination protein O)
MNWTDEAIVLSARPHGESSLLVQLLTRDHGRHAGLARGGRSARSRVAYEPGALVEAHWQARLAEHLGHLRGELVHAHASALIDDPARLACLAALVAVAEAALPERAPAAPVFAGMREVLARLERDEGWAAAYVAWELLLLAELGFGLDLARCGATGATEDLTHVSPKTGRAVCAAAARPYLEKLLPMPGPRDVGAWLRLTGFFLGRHVWAERGEPAARARFAERATTSGVFGL